jgi:hypothetical protein
MSTPCTYCNRFAIKVEAGNVKLYFGELTENGTDHFFTGAAMTADNARALAALLNKFLNAPKPEGSATGGDNVVPIKP